MFKELVEGEKGAETFEENIFGRAGMLLVYESRQRTI